MSTPEFKIEKGIPYLPYARERRRVYPFIQMKVGDSFLIPGTAGRPHSRIPSKDLTPKQLKSRNRDNAASAAAQKFKK